MELGISIVEFNLIIVAKTKEQKKEQLKKVEDLVAESKASGSVAFVKFGTLTVADETKLRRSLRAAGVSYAVVKKTIARLALEKGGVIGELPVFDGQIALAWSSDQIAPARGVYEFQKKLDKKVEIIGGIFENRFMSKVEMTELAMIPSRETLIAQFVNVINSPIQGLVMALNEIGKKRSS